RRHTRSKRDWSSDVCSSDLRPAVRLSSIMNVPVTYVFTHDSIAVGEDGPTHEPVEQLAAFRAMPGLSVIRPADGNETQAAWRLRSEERRVGKEGRRRRGTGG